MSAAYNVLGVVAKLNARMWRYRINFLPINVLLIGGLSFGGYAAATDAIEGFQNASTPRHVSLAQIHRNPTLAQKYVSVTGMDFPVAAYELESKSESGDATTVGMSWTPLLDSTSGRILLVQRSGKMNGGRPQLSTLTGMLRELYPGVRSRLAAQHDSIEGIPVETRYMLVVDTHPADSMTSASIALALFAVVTLFVIASVKRNTIFQRADLAAPTSRMKSTESVAVRGTGTFSLEQSGKVVEQRFVDMASVLGHLDDGTPALFSNIDASSRFMGVTTSKRSGIWMLAISAGSLQDSQTGYLYWGRSRRPAFRFTYKSTRGAKRNAIICADNVETLSAAVALLRAKPAPRAAATA
jgi:energy-converting hydrogenase Eha subunit F